MYIIYKIIFSSEQVIPHYLHFICEMITGFFQCIMAVTFQQILHFAWVMEMVGMPDWKSCDVLPLFCSSLVFSHANSSSIPASKIWINIIR